MKVSGQSLRGTANSSSRSLNSDSRSTWPPSYRIGVVLMCAGQFAQNGYAVSMAPIVTLAVPMSNFLTGLHRTRESGLRSPMGLAEIGIPAGI